MKKKSNGFTHYGDFRRAHYETEAGRTIGNRELIERSAADWRKLNPKEQDYWREQSRKRNELEQNHQMCEPIPPVPNTAPRVKNRGMSKLERELLERMKERGVDRHIARQTLTDKLLWREGEGLEAIIQRRWSIIVVTDQRPDQEDLEDEEMGDRVTLGAMRDLEFVVSTLEKGQTSGEMRTLLKSGGAKKEKVIGVKDVYWDSENTADVSSVSQQICKMAAQSWNNLILVPAYQYRKVASTLCWMKHVRDDLTGRDTSSIRLDRLMCLEDVVGVFRQLNGLPVVDSDNDAQWDELKEMDLDTLLLARATCEYFLKSITKCVETKRTPYPLPSHAPAPLQPIRAAGSLSPFAQVNPFSNGDAPTMTSFAPTSVHNTFPRSERFPRAPPHHHHHPHHPMGPPPGLGFPPHPHQHNYQVPPPMTSYQSPPPPMHFFGGGCGFMTSPPPGFPPFPTPHIHTLPPDSHAPLAPWYGVDVPEKRKSRHAVFPPPMAGCIPSSSGRLRADAPSFTPKDKKKKKNDNGDSGNVSTEQEPSAELPPPAPSDTVNPDVVIYNLSSVAALTELPPPPLPKPQQQHEPVVVADTPAGTVILEAATVTQEEVPPAATQPCYLTAPVPAQLANSKSELDTCDEMGGFHQNPFEHQTGIFSAHNNVVRWLASLSLQDLKCGVEEDSEGYCSGDTLDPAAATVN